MMAGLVSVVVPVYNVEKYLDRCVSSIVGQTYKNLEIILVDDGSPDRSSQICDAWAEKDSRIKVIHKENAGAGMARNTGIENATGEYICFFDSDDYVAPETIAVCYRTAKTEGADIVSFGSYKVDQMGKILEKRMPSPAKPVFQGEEILWVLLPKALHYDTNTGEDWHLSLAPWSSFYSMEIIKKSQWRFVSEREYYSEDFYSFFKLYGYVKKVVILDKIYYYYVVNPTSLTQSYKKGRYERIRTFYFQLLALSREIGIANYVAEAIAAIYLGFSIGCFKQIIAAQGTRKEKLEAMQEIMRDPCLLSVLSENDFPGERWGKKLLWYAIRKKNSLLCYWIVKVRNIKGKVKAWI